MGVRVDPCPECGMKWFHDHGCTYQEPTPPPAPEVPIIDRTGDSDFECALAFAALFYDTPEGL